MKKTKKETRDQKLRRLRAQGRYLGVLRRLPVRKRKQVSTCRDQQGIRAAMQLARSFL